MSDYANIADSIISTGEIINPPRRVKSHDLAVEKLHISIPGGYSGLYSDALTPYMREPSDAIHDRRYHTVCMVSGAQTGKTQSLISNYLHYSIEADPHDVLLLTNSMDRASDFSLRNFDRMVAVNKHLKEKVMTGKASTQARKKMTNGTLINIEWPSNNTLAGRSIRTVLLTDYDRNYEVSEGNVYQLARARTRTFMSRGKVIVESSPSCDLLERDWEPSFPHQAPPTEGVFSIYNQGTMHRYYLPCQHCGEYFLQPAGIEGMYIPEVEGMTIAEAAAASGIPCPSCGALNESKHKTKMVAGGLWVGHGQTIVDGKVTGDVLEARVASYWLPGVCAGFNSWREMVSNYLNAKADYERTGSEETLKGVTNTDWCDVYIYESQKDDTDPSIYQLRAEPLEKKEVPAEARCLISAVDVQKGRFVCQVMAYGESGECWLVDRFNLKYSERLDENGESYNVNPAGFAEDWDVLIDRVIDAEYSTADGKVFTPVLTLCDSGGEPGVTPNAYSFYRKMKRLGKSGKFQLVKGASSSMRDNFKITHPDERKTGTKSGAKGDIPLAMLNTNSLKDIVYGKLSREVVGAGFMHFPGWIGDWFYNELVSEVREKGKYVKKSQAANNEALDLYAYAEAGLLIKGYDKINWAGAMPFWIGPNKGIRGGGTAHRPQRGRTRHTFDNGM